MTPSALKLDNVVEFPTAEKGLGAKLSLVESDDEVDLTKAYAVKMLSSTNCRKKLSVSGSNYFTAKKLLSVDGNYSTYPSYN